MARLDDIVTFCDHLTRRASIKDFPGSHNGLQLANNGSVSKVGSAVDAGLEPFRQAAAAGVEFIIVHHGMFWESVVPVVGRHRDRLALCLHNNIAVYGAHLPLDAHPEIGNNAILARRLGLHVSGTFLPYEGVDIGLVADFGLSRDDLKVRLSQEFPGGFKAIEFGDHAPERIGILTGSGSSAVDKLRAAGVDTLITGELRQQWFNFAQEEGLNLYVCGHYATEVYGVQALADAVSREFHIENTFIRTDCPL